MRAVKLYQRGVKDPLGRLVMSVTGAEIGIEMSYRLGSRAAPAPYALPAGFAMFLAVGTVAAALHGRLPAGGVLIACALVAFVVSFAAEPVASVLLAGIGWLTVIGFSRPPYAQLRPAGPAAVHAAVVVGVTALAGAGFGLVFRWYWRRLTLVSVGRTTGMRRGASSGVADGAADAAPGGAPGGAPSGAPGAAIGLRRRLAGVLLAAVLLPLLTVVLATARSHLNLADFVLVYLVAVVAITVIGGFWPAVLAAVAASLLLNWYFTAPIHTFTIAQPRELLALLLFVTVAVAVSSVVHLAARRALQAARAREEAASLLELAQTVLGGADSPAAVLEHLTRTHGGQAELQERVAGRWVRAASSGVDGALAAAARIDIRSDLTLMVTGQDPSATPALLAGYAAQAAAALDRERLRTQAAQAEALAEGNRMRTALLAAVSHDLRTPLASIKASVSSLRQTDVEWSEADEADLLATIEQNADRLDALIGNLLDMSRLHTGSLQPFLRPTAIDEVAPVAAGGLDDSLRLEMAVPDGFPLVLADPGLLERVLANLFSNALRYSPPGRPPELHAVLDGGTVRLEVADHGPGVPDELKERIFEPFERVGDRHPGVGLGLAVARGFAEAMGGRIGAFDTPGGGLTVRVTLPAAIGDRSALDASRSSEPSRSPEPSRSSEPSGSPESSRSPGSSRSSRSPGS
jgi:two-component system sensor histidine kinase KdpD